MIDPNKLRDMETRLATLQARGDRLAKLLDEVQRQGCEICNGDCASANPPVGYCPTKARSDALTEWRKGC